MKTVKDYNLLLNSLKRQTTTRKNKHCAILPSLCRHCQSKTQQKIGASYAFFAHQTSWPSDLASGVRVTCDVGYLCANFSLPRPLCSRLTTYATDRQTSDAYHRLMPPPCGGGGHNNYHVHFVNRSLSISWPQGSNHYREREKERFTTVYMYMLCVSLL